MSEQPSLFPSEGEKFKSQEVYVTELVDEQDRWFSVTDASRIARRQEHTIRSWISTGALPVHPERTGLNKRTRRIRMSDLQKLTPIVDIDAAIATEIGSLDLPSLPREFTLLRQHIRQNGEQTQKDIQQLTERQTVFQQEIHQSLSELEQQFTSNLHHSSQQLQTSLITLQERMENLNHQLVESDQHMAQDIIQVQQQQQQTVSHFEEITSTLQQSLSTLQHDQLQVAERQEEQIKHWEKAQSELEERLLKIDENILYQLSDLEQKIIQTFTLSLQSLQEQVTQSSQQALAQLQTSIEQSLALVRHKHQELAEQMHRALHEYEQRSTSELSLLKDQVRQNELKYQEMQEQVVILQADLLRERQRNDDLQNRAHTQQQQLSHQIEGLLQWKKQVSKSLKNQ